MKKQINNIIRVTRSFLPVLFVLISGFSLAQQQYTQTVTTLNRNCNSGCSVIEIPELTGNTAAIILATPVSANGVNPNPHTIGAYYMYLNKWSIFNLDGTAIPLGAKFNVEYYLNQDSTRFVYVVPPRVNINDVAYIDHTGLNNHPNAQVRVFPHVSYVSLGNTANKDEVKLAYDASVSKWYVANINNTPVPSTSAYNIVFSNVPGGPGPIGNNPGGNCNCAIPTSLPPNGAAGGDLSGTYPNPKVKGLQGNPLSNITPAVGQVLKWDGISWIPAEDKTGNAGSVSLNKPSVLYFNQSNMVSMDDPNVNIKSLVGLDNQVITLTQSSRVVFYTTIDVEASDLNLIQGGATSVWLAVEILNSSNIPVAKSFSHTWLALFVPQSINSFGIGILPAGTYKTRVSINRDPGGAKLSVFVYNGVHPFQGGQTIIEIFPD
jgi:hypothetical protein